MKHEFIQLLCFLLWVQLASSTLCSFRNSTVLFGQLQSQSHKVLFRYEGATPVEIRSVRQGRPFQDSKLWLEQAEEGIELAQGDEYSLQIGFHPNRVGIHELEVVIETEPKNEIRVHIRGLAMNGLFANNEPSLQRVFEALSFSTWTGDDDPSNVFIRANYEERRQLVLGDEIPNAQSFRKVDPSAPVSIELLATFGPDDVDPFAFMGWYDVKEPTTSAREFLGIRTYPGHNTQTLFPQLEGEAGFDPGELEFGIITRWPVFNNHLIYSEDYLNNYSLSHLMRKYPVKYIDGTVERDAVIVVLEEAPDRGLDFNDLVWIMRNVKPVGTEALLEGPDRVLPTGEKTTVCYPFVFDFPVTSSSSEEPPTTTFSSTQEDTEESMASSSAETTQATEEETIENMTEGTWEITGDPTRKLDAISSPSPQLSVFITTMFILSIALSLLIRH